MAEKYQEPIIVSTHPRTRKRLEVMNQVASASPVPETIRVSGLHQTTNRARCVLSDSGTITEESSILNFPASLRSRRPEGFEEAAVMMVGLSVDRVMQGLAILDSQPRGGQRMLRLVNRLHPAQRFRQGDSDYPKLHGFC